MSTFTWKFLLLSLPLLLAQGAASETPAPFVIYGADDRIDYYQETDPLVQTAADSTVAVLHAGDLTPYGNSDTLDLQNYGGLYGLCPTERFYDQSIVAFCSGFLVDSDTIVTAGHCIYDQSSCDDARLVFGFKIADPNLYPATVPPDHVFSCKKVVYAISDDSGADFAVIKLDRPVSFVAPLPFRHSGSPAVGDPLRVIGYPAGLPVKIAGGANLRALTPTYLVANLDTYGGNSGSPVFNRTTGDVEGVLVRGETDFVTTAAGCMVSNVCPDTGCSGEQVTLIAQILPYL